MPATAVAGGTLQAGDLRPGQQPPGRRREHRPEAGFDRYLGDAGGGALAGGLVRVLVLDLSAHT